MKGLIDWCKAHPLIAIVVAILLLVPALNLLIAVLKLVALATSILLKCAVYGVLLAGAVALIAYLVKNVRGK